MRHHQEFLFSNRSLSTARISAALESSCCGAREVKFATNSLFQTQLPHELQFATHSSRPMRKSALPHDLLTEFSISPHTAFLVRRKGFPQNISNALFCQPMMVIKVMLNP